MVSNSKSATQSKFNALELLARIRADNVLSSSFDSGHKQPNVSQNSVAGLEFSPDNDGYSGLTGFDSINRDVRSHNPSIDPAINLKSRDSYPSHVKDDKNETALLSSGYDSFDSGGRGRNNDRNEEKDESIHARNNNDTQNINNGMYGNNRRSNYNSHHYRTPNTTIDNKNFSRDESNHDNLKNYIQSSEVDNNPANSYKHTYDTDDNDDSVSGKDYFNLILNNGHTSNNGNEDRSRSDNNNSNNNNNNNNYNNNSSIRNRNDNNDLNHSSGKNNRDYYDLNENGYYGNVNHYRNSRDMQDEVRTNNMNIDFQRENNRENNNNLSNHLRISDFDHDQNNCSNVIVSKSNFSDALYDEINKLKIENKKLEKINENLIIEKIEFEVLAKENKKKSDDVISNLRCELEI